MKNALTTIILCATSMIAGQSTFALDLGAKAPLADVKMQDVSGAQVSINSSKGAKGTLVIFTCNHCPYSKAWEERYAAFGNEIKNKGIGVIAINPNDPKVTPADGLDGMKAKAKRLGMKFSYAVDSTSDIARAFGAQKTPEFYLFNADGVLIYKGAFDDDAEDPKAVKQAFLKEATEAYLSGQKIAQRETRAVGCGIKFRN